MPLGSIGPHLKQAHGWTAKEIEAYVFHGRAPDRPHRRWPLHPEDMEAPRPIRPCDQCCQQIDFDGSCPACTMRRQRFRARPKESEASKTEEPDEE